VDPEQLVGLARKRMIRIRWLCSPLGVLSPVRSVLVAKEVDRRDKAIGTREQKWMMIEPDRADDFTSKRQLTSDNASGDFVEEVLIPYRPAPIRS
jgi:hypothetical protein